MGLSKLVSDWSGGVNSMSKVMREEHTFWGDLHEIRHERHIVGERYYDDLTGEELDASLVIAARADKTSSIRRVMRRRCC